MQPHDKPIRRAGEIEVDPRSIFSQPHVLLAIMGVLIAKLGGTAVITQADFDGIAGNIVEESGDGIVLTLTNMGKVQ